MRIHENPEIEQIAVETIAAMQLGMDELTLRGLILAYEEVEDFESCLGIQLGIEYYKNTEFNCKIKNITYEA